MPNDNQASQEWLLYYLADLILNTTEKRDLATRALLGKTYLISGYYQEALQQCQYILDSKVFSLDPEATNQSDSQEVLWGGYKDNFGNPGGSYIHPILCVKYTSWPPSLILSPGMKCKPLKSKSTKRSILTEWNRLDGMHPTATRNRRSLSLLSSAEHSHRTNWIQQSHQLLLTYSCGNTLQQSGYDTKSGLLNSLL